MNVEKIKMDQGEARAMLREYRKQIGAQANVEYSAVEAGLALMAKGLAVINLHQAIGRAGFDGRDRPKLAVCRADRTQVRFSWGRHQEAALFSTIDTQRPRRGRMPRNDQHSINFGRRPHESCCNRVGGWEVEAYAMVPMVPPRALRQARLRGTTTLGQLVVLWEVERWHETQQGNQPPRDPFLLRRLGGDLYVVLAEWDLTPLEQAVIAGTRR